MTDRAEREVRKWALKRNGNPISNTDIVELVFAFADDQDADHATTMELLEIAKRERTVLCQKVTDLELWQHETQNKGDERTRKLIRDEHDKRHGEHMQTHHSDDASFQQRFVWWWGGKLAYIIFAMLITAINIALNMLWFGKP